MIVNFPTHLTAPEGLPLMLLNQAAVAPCGCSVYVGLRVDTKEAVSLAGCCAPGHEALIATFNEALIESLADPEDRPLVEVCDEILTLAAAPSPTSSA